MDENTYGYIIFLELHKNSIFSVMFLRWKKLIYSKSEENKWIFRTKSTHNRFFRKFFLLQCDPVRLYNRLDELLSTLLDRSRIIKGPSSHNSPIKALHACIHGVQAVVNCNNGRRKVARAWSIVGANID